MTRREHLLSLLVGPAAAKSLLAQNPKPPAIPLGPAQTIAPQKLPLCNFNITSAESGLTLFSAPLETDWITLGDGDTLILNIKIEVD